ncbi:MlaD family protein [Cupriavidus sp. WKF15]|uniref:MlaD family protein n=1 Tax=Cupriavidus sp. WKF15 TaxID=3032282 RepID=UPI0023E1AF66|nr:MlaD family protein [Cupriavidus sp. WKF15]WER49166.1 MlaD family protein [Cupriavidus sp. WKF15]
MKPGIDMKAKLLFAACLLVATIAAATWYLLSSSRYATYHVYTREPVSGLMADAPVEFHGIEVGKVDSVKLVNAQTVDILVSLDKTAPVTAATVATITSRGLATRGFTGYVFIALENVGADSGQAVARPGDRYPAIPAAPSKVVTLDTAISQVNDNFQAVTALLTSILDERTIASLKQSADSLQKITQAMAEDTRKLDAIVANTERASHRIGPLMESTQQTVLTLQGQVLPESYRVLADLDNLSNSLTAVTNRINRDPSILIRGTAPSPGPGEKR